MSSCVVSLHLGLVFPVPLWTSDYAVSFGLVPGDSPYCHVFYKYLAPGFSRTSSSFDATFWGCHCHVFLGRYISYFITIELRKIINILTKYDLIIFFYCFTSLFVCLLVAFCFLCFVKMVDICLFVGLMTH